MIYYRRNNILVYLAIWFVIYIVYMQLTALHVRTLALYWSKHIACLHIRTLSLYWSKHPRTVTKSEKLYIDSIITSLLFKYERSKATPCVVLAYPLDWNEANDIWRGSWRGHSNNGKTKVTRCNFLLSVCIAYCWVAYYFLLSVYLSYN